MTIHNDLARLLRETLEERCRRNPRYSLRAFARDLGVQAPRLSRWLKGQEGLSRASAASLAKSLGLSVPETEAFVTAMEARYARASKVREGAIEKLKSISGSYSPLDADAFKAISNWYHLAILSLLGTEGCGDDIEWISRRLGISVYEAEAAITRLAGLEMLERLDGRLRATGVFFANPAGVPSRGVRAFHSEILEKAKASLELQTVDERDHSALVVAVDAARIDEARAFIRKFREEFDARFCRSDEPKNEVYALGVQFFRLTEKTPAASRNSQVPEPSTTTRLTKE